MIEYRYDIFIQSFFYLLLVKKQLNLIFEMMY
jgi:hypothetical protein